MAYGVRKALFRSLGRLYPDDYRRARWDDIETTYEDGLADGRPRVRWTAVVVLDLVLQAPACWVEKLRRAKGAFRMDLGKPPSVWFRMLRLVAIAVLLWSASL